MTVQVKGTVLIDLVKQVRAEKDKNWGEYLTAKDMEIIDSEVLTSSWSYFPIATAPKWALLLYICRIRSLPK